MVNNHPSRFPQPTNFLTYLTRCRHASTVVSSVLVIYAAFLIESVSPDWTSLGCIISPPAQKTTSPASVDPQRRRFLTKSLLHNAAFTALVASFLTLTYSKCAHTRTPIIKASSQRTRTRCAYVELSTNAVFWRFIQCQASTTIINFSCGT